jgi:hypothetical protein
MTALQFLKKGEAEVKGYKIGLPGTKTYKAKTPKKFRIVGEAFLFVGFAIGALAMPLGLPAWVIAAGSVAGYLGKKVTKMVGEIED